MERRLSAIMAADMAGFSHLIEQDELGTLTRQKAHRAEVVDPAISRFRGRIVKSTGDGFLAEFGSVHDAVACGFDMQETMKDRDTDQPVETRIRYRIGINLGDVVADQGDIFGDGVNVAARLEGLADPGGLCVSDNVRTTVPETFGSRFRDMGSQRVKNISRPIRAWAWSPDRESGDTAPPHTIQQDVRFCTSADGTTIAWATAGHGTPVLRAPHWMNHLEYEWKNPFKGHFLSRIAQHHRLVRFDQRGNGLSDRDVDRISVDAMMEDMEAVVEAAGIDRFALLGISQGAAFSVQYALRHPEQVSCIVLLGGYLRGRVMRDDAEQTTLYEAARIMIRDGWGSHLPVFRNFFTNSHVPDAPVDIQAKFDEVQRVSIDPEMALRVFDMNGAVLVPPEDAARLQVPVLVAHVAGDRVCPASEGRFTARAIPGARFIELTGNNHMPLETDPGFSEFFDAVLPFLGEHS